MQKLNWRNTLSELKLELQKLGAAGARPGELAGRLEAELDQMYRDSIDMREYCESCGQALCITDEYGVITYMNREYARETMLNEHEDTGKPEPFSNPVSRHVLQKQAAVTFGNDGSRLNLKNGRMVSGVPVFDEAGKIRRIVITLSTEELIYQRYRELRELMNRKESVRILEGTEDEFQSLLGKNPAVKEIRSLIRMAAPTDATILITGESGSGKEVVADCIYALSGRKGKPFVKINCAAIPPNLLEAELFGYEKGAFTGANARKLGLFEMANEGTLMLDEVGDFPLELQPKLLRVLQQGELYRIGSSTPVKLDVRVIAATNADLRRRMREGTFREDLYYRINVFPIHMPSLRERKDDILGLVNYYLDYYGKKYNRVVELPADVSDLLRGYDWPGNVREMQNVVEYYVICSGEGKEIGVEQLTRVLQINFNEISDQAGPPASSPALPKAPQPQGSLFELRDSYEKQLILDALHKTNSGRKAAKLLGIFPSSLYRKAQKYNIPIAEEESEGEDET